MKNIISLLLLGAGLVWLSGCASGKKLNPVSFYRLQGADTVSWAQHSLEPDSLQILVVRMTENIVGKKDYNDVKVSSGSIQTYPNVLNGRNSLSGIDMSHSEVSGRIRNPWLDDMVLSRIHNQLEYLSIDYGKSLLPAQKEVSRQGLDDLLKRHDVNWVIAVDSILFQLDARHTRSVQYMDREIPAPGVAVESSEFEKRTSDGLVDYQLYLTFYKVDETSHEVTEEIHLLQHGQYKSTETANTMQLAASCALKAGDDFALLFKPKGNQQTANR